jgi:hypothetical protein
VIGAINTKQRVSSSLALGCYDLVPETNEHTAAKFHYRARAPAKGHGALEAPGIHSHCRLREVMWNYRDRDRAVK